MTRTSVSRTEELRQTRQAQFDAHRSAAQRNRLGQFATPHALAVQIAEYTASLLEDSRKPVRFADPSIGSGSFFSAALSVFGPRKIRSAIGVELDPALRDMARSLWSDNGLEVVSGDFTRVVADVTQLTPPNLILANPPYVRHHHLTRDDKARLQQLVHELVGIEVSGLAGLYVYFLLLATAWMADDGIAAWLVPSEFMDVNYGLALKRFLTERVTLVRVHRFDPDDVQFGDALVSSVVIVFRKSVPARPDHPVEFTYGGSMASPKVHEVVKLSRLRTTRKWTVYPNHSSNDRQSCSAADVPRLGDLFRIQRGIATGSNRFFVLDRADAVRRGLPARFLRPILPSPRHLPQTRIDSADDGYPLIDRQLALIDCDLPERIVKAEFSALWRYLQTADGAGIRDRYLVTRRDPWYRQERREPAPFMCTYMGRGSNEKQPFRFLWNRSEAIGTNLYLLLYPKGALATLLKKHPSHAQQVHSLLARVSAYELRGEGRVYGGGLNKIEPKELARVSAAAIVDRWPQLASIARRDKALRLFD